MESLYGIYYYYLELKLKPSGHVGTLSLLREHRKQLKWWRGKDLQQTEKEFSFLTTSSIFLTYFCCSCYSLPNFWQVSETNTYHAASCSSKSHFIIVYNHLARFPGWYFSLSLVVLKSICIACTTGSIFTNPLLLSNIISAAPNPFVSFCQAPTHSNHHVRERLAMAFTCLLNRIAASPSPFASVKTASVTSLKIYLFPW